MSQSPSRPLSAREKHRAKFSALMLATVLAVSACSTATPRPSTATIKVPVAAGSQLKIGDKTTIEGNATGANITRVEVLVNGQLYATQTTQDPTQGVAEFKMSPLPWSPNQSGTNVVQLRVYDKDNKKVAESEPVIVMAQGDAPAPAAAAPTTAPAVPAPTTAPAAAPTTAPAAQAPAPTVAPTAAAAVQPASEARVVVTNEFVNVRSGPDTSFDLLGKLDQNKTAKLLGRSEDGKWWQIQFDDGKGWVFGEYVKAENASAISVAAAPAAPAKPTAAPQPTAPSVSLQSLPTAPPPPAAPAPAPAQPAVVVVTPASVAPASVAPAPAPSSGAAVGSRGILRVNATIVPLYGTVVASWDVQNVKEVKFDAGDGRDYQPAGGTMTVNVAGVSGQRNLRLRVVDNNNNVTEDTIQVRGDAAYGTNSGGGPATGSAGLLKVNIQVVPVNGSVVANWNVSNVRRVDFDSGDGGGYKPAAGEMSVKVDGINGTRTLRLKVEGNDGTVREDSVTVRSDTSLGTQAAAAPVASSDCNPNDPNYRDKGGNGPYKFCVAKDLGWVNLSGDSVQRFAAGTDKEIIVAWNVYGINGVRLAADPSDQISNCAPKGSGGFNVPVNGNGTHSFNLKTLGQGQYKLELFITRKDGQTVGHNEIFLCLQ